MRVDSGSAAVARDMERVFAGLSIAARPASDRPDPGARAAAKPASSGIGRLAWPLLAAIIAIAAIAFFLTRQETPLSPPQDAPERSAAIAAEPLSAPPTPSVRAASPAAPAASMTKLAPPEVSSRPRPVQVRAVAKPARPLAPKSEKAGSAQARAATASGSPVCRGVPDRAGCFYRKVLAADRGVRQAYARAATAGVPIAELYRARGVWKSALSRSRRQPLVAIGTLEGLAADLSTRAAAASGT